jgi:hypothetical protein
VKDDRTHIIFCVNSGQRNGAEEWLKCGRMCTQLRLGLLISLIGEKDIV